MTTDRQWVAEQARIALANLEHLTTDAFSKGEDRPARVALAAILDACDAAEPWMLREYLGRDPRHQPAL